MDDGKFAFNPPKILGEYHEKIFFFKIPDSNYCYWIISVWLCDGRI